MAQISSKQRALVALVVLVLAACGAATYFYLRAYRPAPAIATGGPLPGILTLLPSNAPVVVFADLKSLRTSPFIQQAEATTAVTTEDPDYAEFVRETGFDYSRDLDAVAFAAWPETAQDILDVQSGRPPAGSSITIADGRFDQAKIISYCMRKGSLTHSGTHDVYQIREADRTLLNIAFLAPTRIAISVAKDLTPVFAPARSLSAAPDIAARMKRVAGAPLFAVGHIENLPSAIPFDFGNSQQLRELLASIKGFAIAGQSKAQDFDLAADIDCDSGAHAFQLATLLDTFRWIGRAALADPGNRKKMTRSEIQLYTMLLSAVRVAHDDYWLQFRLEGTPAMLRLAFPHKTANRSTNAS